MNEYIFRAAEEVSTDSVSGKSRIKCFFKAVIVVVIVAFLCSGGYGIAVLVQAAPNAEREEQARQTAELLEKMQEAEVSLKRGQSIITAEGIVLTPVEQQVADEQLTATNTAQLSLEAEDTNETVEETLAGLLWNEDLIADISARVEEAGTIDSEDIFDEEDYKELLVTLGMDEDYVSDASKAPDYLTMTYNPDMVMDLTEEELSALLTLVEAEAPSEDIYGKILVANVVLNRVFSDTMADDVIGVIFEKIGGSAQFSPTAIKWYWNSIKVTDSTREAVARCLSGEDYSNGALYFYAWAKHPNKQNTSSWLQKCEYLFTHGGHIFFK